MGMGSDGNLLFVEVFVYPLGSDKFVPLCDGVVCLCNLNAICSYILLVPISSCLCVTGSSVFVT